MAYPGNAPPMRALPLAFLPDDLMLRYSMANAESTHPHPKALVVASLRGLDAAGDTDGADEETLRYLERVDALPPPRRLPCEPPFLAADALETLCGPQPIWRTAAEGGTRPRRVTGLEADAMRTAGCVLWLLKHHVAGQPLDTLL
eukprot:CAMPEP_0117596608 /NCGR_PEP_ID=MMETSP0784-20121206/74406_1 /TAXON_ID=39447 /ORGANISM="" /LENGTH=144 /DNA_ID=CAMNT_0005398907 /DNA_START=1 /DNA_END=431 /DNA_ORIENTATION=+